MYNGRIWGVGGGEWCGHPRQQSLGGGKIHILSGEKMDLCIQQILND
jgi:hypothetical protein